MRTFPDFENPAGNWYVCCFFAFGRLKLRDGPSRVENLTGQIACGALFAQSLQVAATVFVCQDRPLSTRSSRSDSQMSAPYGSNAFGQPFQPARGPVWPDQICQVFSRSGWPKSVPPCCSASSPGARAG